MNRFGKFWAFRRWLLVVGPVMLILPVAGFYLLNWIFPQDFSRVAEAEQGGATEILDCKGGLIAWRVDDCDSWRVPVSIDEISPWVIKAIVATEDQRFWEHHGIDPLALSRALSQNIRLGRRVSGASTISMQLMRLLQPDSRTITTKCREAFRALQTERGLKKEEVLQLYLNLAPFGGNVVGIEAAARRYFDKSAKFLTLAEAALLCGIPQSPARFNPLKHLDSAMKRRDYVLTRMQELQMVTDKELQTALREPMRIVTKNRSVEAPRFADYILARSKSRGGIIRTTIDPEVQGIVTVAAQKHYAELSDSGVDGMAVVVVDVKQGKLLAMLGNADPDDPVHGFVNGAARGRQPGSLLKPFIYCAAFEQGLLTPASVVYDIPASWKEYKPENIDHEYLGAISVTRALALSRNVPAVKTLQKVGVQRFVQKLSKMGVEPVGAVEEYGLSLALGTAQMKLVDIVNAYATLARNGQYLPLQVFNESARSKPQQVFSAPSVWLTLQALSGSNDRKFLWKTGTSWNHRDAWAVCISPRYAIGVWCGNFSGKGNAGLVGARAALPVALDLAGRLDKGATEIWHKPEGIGSRKVCALSGCPAGLGCTHTVVAAYIPGVSASTPCPLHRAGAENKGKVYWPERVAAFMDQSKPKKQQTAGKGLELLSPISGAKYFISDAPGNSGTHLDFASVASTGEMVSYYLDGEFVGKAGSGKVLRWKMLPGSHDLIAATKKKSIRVGFTVSEIDVK